MSHSYELRLALREGRTGAARSIINSPGFNPNISIEMMTTKFPIVLAAEMGNEEIVHLLIEKGADLTAQGTNALIAAIEGGHVNIVRNLLTYPEIDVNAMQRFPKFNPLHSAIRNHVNIEIIKLLLAHGADVNMKDGFGNTPLAIALHGSHFYQEYTNQLLDLLLQNTTLDINESTNNALKIVEYQYHTANPMMRNFYANLIMKLLAHGAVHPDKNTHARMLNGRFICTCGLYGACPCNTMGASRFLQNRRNATLKRRQAALTAWHVAHKNEFENEEPVAAGLAAAVPAAAAQVNNGTSSVEAALKAFRNLGYRVGKNARKTMRRRQRK